jgi:putative Holliday junction resolvase
MRILGIDPGERRIGLAISDDLGITAQGLETFDKKSGQDLLAFLSTLFDEYGVDEIVVGNPVHLSGGVSESSQMAQQLAAVLQKRFDVPVTLWDERLSSEEAKRVLRGSRARKGTIDRVAAVLILQSYLDHKRNRP